MEKCVFDRCKDDIIKIITKADDSWDKNRPPRLFPIGMAGRNLPFSGVIIVRLLKSCLNALLPLKHNDCLTVKNTTVP